MEKAENELWIRYTKRGYLKNLGKRHEKSGRRERKNTLKDEI